MSERGLQSIPKKRRKSVEKRLKALSHLIQERREKMGLTQEGLAEELEISTMTLQFIEQGRRFPSLPMLFYITERLGIEVRFE